MNTQRDYLKHPRDEVDTPISWEPSLSVLKFTIAAMLVGSFFVFIANRILVPDQPLRTLGSVLVSLVAVVGWYLLSLGRAQAAVYVLAYGVWTVVTGLAVFTGGVRAPVVFVYPMLILLIGWVISSRAAIVAAGLTLTAIVGFVLADVWNLLPNPLPTSPVLHGIIQITLTVVAAALIGRVVRAYQNRLFELKAISNDLTLRTRDLEAAKAELNRAQAVGKVGSWIYDIANDTMRLSPETCRIFGLPEGTPGSHRSYLARTHEQDRSALESAWQAALSGKAGFDHEHRIVVRREIRWVRQKAEFEFASNGTALGAVGVAQDITERKRAEATIKELNLDFVSFLENTSDFIYFKDVNSRFRFCSQTLANITGHASWRDMIGKHDLEVFPADTAKIYNDEEFPIFHDGKPLLNKLNPYYDAAGNRGWINTSKWPLLDQEGKVVGLFGISRDVSALKEAEDALRESEEFFRLIAENIGDFIAVLDLDGRRLYNSPSYKQFFGTETDLHGTDSFAEIHPDDRERVKQIFQDTVQSGVGQEIEYRFVRPDGTIRVMDSLGAVIRDSEGRVARVVVVSHDITGRKQLDQQLRIAATAFEAQEGMAITDPNHVVLRVNRAFSEITGYTAEEAVGRNMRFLKSDRQGPDFYAEMWKAIQSKGAWQGEIWNRTKNGEVHPHWLTVSAVRNGDERITHFVGTYLDITERKQMEEKVHQLAFYDALSKLPNRRLLYDRMSQTMAASKRSGCYAAAMFLDLDNFKPLNDTNGHGAGDLLLIAAADRLKNCVRETDTVARFGGDEFVVIISELEIDRDASVAQARLIAEKIRCALSEPYLLTLKHENEPDSVVEHRCTASIGVALFINHEASQDDILKWADKAMYLAKEAGRNSICFY